jgi:NAD(P)-dependent dehydrogenase (short-subunit alcohol dehydrogenase family)
MSAITTPFGFSSTAAGVAGGIDLAGRRALVTGASSGIGAEKVRALATTGAAVTLAVRDMVAGQRVAKDITATTGNHDVHAAHLDLTGGWKSQADRLIGLLMDGLTAGAAANLPKTSAAVDELEGLAMAGRDKTLVINERRLWRTLGASVVAPRA